MSPCSVPDSSSMASHGSFDCDISSSCVDLLLVPIWVVCALLAALPVGSTGVAQSPPLPVGPAYKVGARAAVCLTGAAGLRVDVAGLWQGHNSLFVPVLLPSWCCLDLISVFFLSHNQHGAGCATRPTPVALAHLLLTLSATQLSLECSGSQVSLQITGSHWSYSRNLGRAPRNVLWHCAYSFLLPRNNGDSVLRAGQRLAHRCLGGFGSSGRQAAPSRSLLRPFCPLSPCFVWVVCLEHSVIPSLHTPQRSLLCEPSTAVGQDLSESVIRLSVNLICF